MLYLSSSLPLLISISICFDSVQRRRRHGSVTTRTPHQYWCVYDYEGTFKNLTTPSTRMQRNNINSSRIISLKFIQKEARASFRPSETIHNHKSTFETRHSKKAQGVLTRHNSKKDTNRPAQSTKTCHTSFSLIVSSHHNPLLSCHSPSVREGISCNDSRPLGSVTQPGLVHFLACPGQCGKSMPPLPAPNPSRREILRPSPCNPMTCSDSLHTLLSRESLVDTLSSSGQASPSLSRIGLFGQPNFHSSLPDQEKDIHLLRLFLLQRSSARQ